MLELDNNINMLLDKLIAELIDGSLTLSVAESCTGGLLGAILTQRAGSSRYFNRGFVTYSNQSKIDLLKVNPDIIKEFGAVSQECAHAMALGCYAQSQSSLCLSITGIAGPEGGDENKKVGLVYMGYKLALEKENKNITDVKQYNFSGSRDQIRAQAIKEALMNLYWLSRQRGIGNTD